MRDGNSKKSKLSWSKSLVKKWFNITCKYEDFQADEVAYGNKFIKNTDQIIQGREYLDHPGIVDVKNYSIFVATWNVGGKSPPSNLNSDDWLHGAPPADIFVLGFQEIVPLNASNILGAEDNGPAKKWLALIRKTLNDIPRTSGSSGCHTPSPVPNLIIEINADFEGSDKQKAASLLRRRSFQMPGSWKMDTDPSTSHPRHDRSYNVCDRVSFCRRPSDYRRSDFSRWGSFDEDCGPLDSPSTVLFSPTCCDGSIHIDDGYQLPKQSRYCLVVSKQMVGIFLTVWVRKDLRDSVRNVKVSCVGRGLMGYLGNKGSISVSMLLHQTSFCFICTHLTSGQKEGDELRRNSDVMEILKKTRFPKVNEMDDDKSPETIIEHDRVIWLGDLNYRVALSYRSVKALVEMQNWRALLERDQLRIEQKRGRVFTGWNEGNIYFLPTYKYLHNSDRYAGGVHPKEKRRTPAWKWSALGNSEMSVFTMSYIGLVGQNDTKSHTMKGKEEPKMMQCVFLGYGEDELDYRFYDLVGRRRLVRSMDVTFVEDETIKDIDRKVKCDVEQTDKVSVEIICPVFLEDEDNGPETGE